MDGIDKCVVRQINITSWYKFVRIGRSICIESLVLARSSYILTYTFCSSFCCFIRSSNIEIIYALSNLWISNSSRSCL